MQKVKVDNNRLIFGDGFTIEAQRTLRVPDDGNTYPLPKGLGKFGLRRIEDYAAQLPARWVDQGGVIIPMHYHEAMYWSFSSSNGAYAVQLAVGMVNAVDGKTYTDTLREKGYMVVPPQRWLDGINTGEKRIRQFVAVRMGDGQSVEAQVTGKEEWGGIQIAVYPSRYPIRPAVSSPVGHNLYSKGLDTHTLTSFASPTMSPKSFARVDAGRVAELDFATQQNLQEMSVGAGGKITQKIYPDPHGIETWDQHALMRVFIHIVDVATWQRLTGEYIETPITQDTYKKEGIPWFDVYDTHLGDLPAPQVLKNVKSFKQLQMDNPEISAPTDTLNQPISPTVSDGKNHW